MIKGFLFIVFGVVLYFNPIVAITPLAVLLYYVPYILGIYNAVFAAFFVLYGIYKLVTSRTRKGSSW